MQYWSTLIFFLFHFLAANFQQLYALHWTGALGAAVMVFAHWFYLAAAVLAMFSTVDEDEGSGENAFTRGQEEMEKERESVQRKKRNVFRSSINLRHDFMQDISEDLDETILEASESHERNILLARESHPEGRHQEHRQYSE